MEHLRHFVGGAAVGFVVALFVLPNRKPLSSWWDIAVWFAAHMLVAIPCGIAAWGLWP